jgi:hypothetical protein
VRKKQRKEGNVEKERIRKKKKESMRIVDRIKKWGMWKK